MKAAPFTSAPKKGKKKKVPMKGSMGGLLAVTPKKPDPDDKLRSKQRSARNMRLAGKMI